MRPSPRHGGASTWRIGVGAWGRREARGAGVLTERSGAERASTRRPEESLSAWSQEPARTRGRPAPQRRSAHHADTAGAKAPRRLRRHGSNRGSKTRARRGAKRTEGSGRNRPRVRKRHRQRKWLRSRIYIYSTTHTQERPSPLTPSGGRTRVCVGARGRAGYQIRSPNAIAKRWGCSRNRGFKVRHSSHSDLGIVCRHTE